jgi:hypothetical protein
MLLTMKKSSTKTAPKGRTPDINSVKSDTTETE